MVNELMLIFFCTLGILILLGYLAYRVRQESKREMTLDRGGRIDAYRHYTPDMSRADIQDYFIECEQIQIPKQFAEEFLLHLFNMSKYLVEPDAPKIDHSLIEVWGIDDDIEDLINPILCKRNLKKIKWNEKDILDLRTIGDALSYAYRKTTIL